MHRINYCLDSEREEKQKISFPLSIKPPLTAYGRCIGKCVWYVLAAPEYQTLIYGECSSRAGLAGPEPQGSRLVVILIPEAYPALGDHRNPSQVIYGADTAIR